MHATRANTLPETALVMSLALMVLFGGVQMALAGFDQVSADGAAFLGAHSAVAQSPSSPSGSYANQVAQTVFAHTKTNGLALSNPTGNTTELDYTGTFASIGFSKFLGSGFATTSRIVEPSVGAAGGVSGLPLPYKSTACLDNKINAATKAVADTAIGLPLVSSLTSTDAVTGAIDLSSTGLTAQIGARATLFNNLATTETSLTTDLQGVGTAVNALLTSPLVGSVLGTLNGLLSPTTGTLGTILNGAVQNALAGNTGALTTLGTTVSTLMAAVNLTLAPLEILNPSLTTLATNVTTALNKVVTDVTTLASYENTLSGLDSSVSGTVCP